MDQNGEPRYTIESFSTRIRMESREETRAVALAGVCRLRKIK